MSIGAQQARSVLGGRCPSVPRPGGPAGTGLRPPLESVVRHAAWRIRVMHSGCKPAFGAMNNPAFLTILRASPSTQLSSRPRCAGRLPGACVFIARIHTSRALPVPSANRRIHPSRLALALFAVLLIPAMWRCGTVRAQDVSSDAESGRQLKEKLPEALRRMEDFFSEVRASGSLKLKVESEKSPAEHLMSFVRSGGSSKFSSRQIQPEFNERVWCRNPEKYVFRKPSAEFSGLASR
jgi:hypothetical protein